MVTFGGEPDIDDAIWLIVVCDCSAKMILKGMGLTKTQLAEELARRLGGRALTKALSRLEMA